MGERLTVGAEFRLHVSFLFHALAIETTDTSVRRECFRLISHSHSELFLNSGLGASSEAPAACTTQFACYVPQFQRQQQLSLPVATPNDLSYVIPEVGIILTTRERVSSSKN